MRRLIKSAAVALLAGGALVFVAVPASASVGTDGFQVSQNGGAPGGGVFAPAEHDWGMAPQADNGAPGGGSFAPADNDWGVAPQADNGAPGSGG